MTFEQKESLPYFFSTLLALGVIVIVWKHRRSPGGKAFIWMMLGLAAWAGPAGLEITSNSLSANLIWSIVSYPGVLSVPVFFFLFVLQFTGQEYLLTRRNLALLWIIPGITLLMALTNNWHHLLWSSLVPDPLVGENLIHYGHGPWFYVMLVYLYALVLAGSVLLLKAAFSFQKAFRLQTLAILVSIPLPWLGNLLYILNISPLPGLDTAPIFFTMTGLVLSLAIFRFQLLELVPVAREMVIEGLLDGIMVMDARERIVDINPAAKKLLNLSAGAWLGQPISSLVPQIQQLIDHPQLKLETFSETATPTWVEMHLDPLRSPTGRLLGRLLTLRNITDRKQMELDLQEKTRELERLAVSDSLTGLFNRRYIESALQLEFERCERYHLSLAIAMFDIDLFKGINDRFGHPCGDEVIRRVSRELRACLRSADIAARVGGDEFLALFPLTSLEDGWMAIERLRSLLEHSVIDCTGEGITISGGVTSWFAGDKPNAALQRVDRLLYQAKKQNRNLVLKDAGQSDPFQVNPEELA